MKRHLIILGIALLALATGCKDNPDAFAFKGVVVDYVNCTSAMASISDVDFGYVVCLATPDSVGKAYKASNGNTFDNCVVIYRTRTRFRDSDSISGTMYLDENYSRAYCSFHYDLNIPEGVCYTID